MARRSVRGSQRACAGVRALHSRATLTPRRGDQELEAMKARLKEMEDEAAKLRQMQARAAAAGT